METAFTRAVAVGDLDAARAALGALSVQTVEMEPGTLEGTFVTRRPTTLEVIERAARSWEAFDRLCEPRPNDDWDDEIEIFLDATGLVDWGNDHLFVCGRRVAAFAPGTWWEMAAGWADPETVEQCRLARALGL